MLSRGEGVFLKFRRWKKAFAILILAIICIGGVELAVCRMMDPILYYQITAPVRNTVTNAVSHLTAALDTLSPTETEAEPAQPLPPIDQYASDPAIWADLSNADPSMTELLTQDDGELLTGGTVELIYFNQSDEQWGALPYGTDHIRGYGCGPTAMSMVVSSLTDTFVDPGAMADWATQNHHWAKGSGSYLSIVEGAVASYDLSITPCTEYTAQRLRQELAAGKIAVALMGAGHFTQRGHFIILRGVTLEGDILVADPNSRERSLALWDAQLIIDELAPRYNDGAPLWLISNPFS